MIYNIFTDAAWIDCRYSLGVIVRHQGREIMQATENGYIGTSFQAEAIGLIKAVELTHGFQGDWHATISNDCWGAVELLREIRKRLTRGKSLKSLYLPSTVMDRAVSAILPVITKIGFAGVTRRMNFKAHQLAAKAFNSEVFNG
jgi:hypothetical protein